MNWTNWWFRVNKIQGTEAHQNQTHLSLQWVGVQWVKVGVVFMRNSTIWASSPNQIQSHPTRKVHKLTQKEQKVKTVVQKLKPNRSQPTRTTLKSLIQKSSRRRRNSYLWFHRSLLVRLNIINASLTQQCRGRAFAEFRDCVTFSQLKRILQNALGFISYKHTKNVHQSEADIETRLCNNRSSASHFITEFRGFAFQYVRLRLRFACAYAKNGKEEIGSKTYKLTGLMLFMERYESLPLLTSIHFPSPHHFL